MNKQILLKEIKDYFYFPISAGLAAIPLYLLTLSFFGYAIYDFSNGNLILFSFVFIVMCLLVNAFFYGLIGKVEDKIPAIKFINLHTGFIKTNKKEEDKFYSLIDSSNVNEKNEHGDTILTVIARTNNHSPYIAYLLGIGADPYIKNNDNKCAVDYLDKLYFSFINKNS